MYLNLKEKGIGGFSGDWYWSSSEDSEEWRWTQSFQDGRQYSTNPEFVYKYSVRAIRQF
jgi:hypothetical protein